MGTWFSQHHTLTHKGEIHDQHHHHNHHDHELPRYASLYHSWMGYLAFFWSFIMGLLGLITVSGFWQPRTTIAMLILIIITFLIYFTFMMLNMRWYGNTMTTRLYWRLDILEYARFAASLPKYNTVIERDLKFHN